MNCCESRPLIAAHPLDGLNDAELSALDAHLSDCMLCQGRKASLTDAYDLLTDPVFAEDEDHLPEGAWEKIVAGLAEGGADEAAPPPSGRLAIAVSCTFCHDGLVKTDSTYCASCLAPHHAECFAAHGRCSAPGCEETHTVRPQLEVHLGNKDRRRSRLGFGLGLLVLGGVAAFAGSNALEWYDGMSDMAEARGAQKALGAQARRMVFDGKSDLDSSGYLGARLKDAGSGSGVVITAVLPAGPADVAGLLVGDQILAVSGVEREEVADVASLKRMLTDTFHSGERVIVSVRRTTHHGPPEVPDARAVFEVVTAIEVTLSEAGPPSDYLSGSPSGATYAPAKILGWDGERRLLLSVHGRQTLVLGDYQSCWTPDVDDAGLVTLAQQVAGSKETYHTFSARLPSPAAFLDPPRLGRTLWLKLKDPGDSQTVTLPLDISGGVDMDFDANGGALLLTPEVKRAPVYLGVRVEPREPDDKGVRGLLVNAVLSDGPASTAGLREGDVLVAAEKNRRVEERQLNTLEELRAVLAAHRAGDVLMIRTLRGGESDAVVIVFPAKDGVSVVGDLLIAGDGKPGAVVVPTMLSVVLLSWNNDAVVFTAATQSLIGRMFNVSLGGGASFAQVRVSAKTAGRWLATPLSGGKGALDLPPGTILTLTEVSTEPTQRE